MKILILTSINPVVAASAYHKVLGNFKDEKIQKGILCIPYFAETRARMMNQAFIPTYFAMITAIQEDKRLRDLLFKEKNTVVIGNVYNTQKFDLIVALDESDLDQPFDPYIKEIEENEDLEEFKEKVNLKNLYTIDDAEIVLPTEKHLILYLEGVLGKNEKHKLKQ